MPRELRCLRFCAICAGALPILVAIGKAPGIVERGSGFIQPIGRALEAADAVGIAVFFRFGHGCGDFVIAQRNIIVRAVAQAGIDQAIGLIALDGFKDFALSSSLSVMGTSNQMRHSSP